MPAYSQAYVLINELISHGIDYFCLSPGSRSTPLTHSVAMHPKARSFVHFDERGMAFHALGYAKASKKPAVIIVTSGTACGNLLPAIMEAHESSIPLIIFTADRPQELLDCGANQVTDQMGMFRQYVRWQINLAIEESISDDCLKTTITQGIAKSTHDISGPVHINCMFREPFFGPLELLSESSYTRLISSEKTLSSIQLGDLSKLLSAHKKGLIIVGYESFHSSDLGAIEALAKKLHFPFIIDIASFAYQSIDSRILYYEMIVKHLKCNELKPTCVLHFGGGYVSKFLLEFISHATTYIHVDDKLKRQNPKHLSSYRVDIKPSTFCELILPYLESATENHYLSLWKHLDDQIGQSIAAYFEKEGASSEPSFFHHLSSYDLSSFSLFIGNSMPIRDALNYYHPEKAPSTIYASRGLSGIDGNIATSAGIAHGSNRKTIAIIGDMTFLHDINSLAQLKFLKHPLHLVVLNNNGGNIFSLLPIGKKEDLCRDYFITPHGLSFKEAAACFQIPYHSYDNTHAAREDFERLMSSESSSIIEIAFEQKTNLKVHEEIASLIKTISFSENMLALR